MSRFGKVAVLMGGPSAEREISLLSGGAVLEALLDHGVDAHAFDPAERALCDLKHDRFDRAFVALHGRFGEDGTVQGALETMKIPYTGSGVMASALAMDKWRTKLVWLAAGIPTPRYVILDAQSDWADVARTLGLPLIVKPAHEGSTLGLTKAVSVEQLPPAYAAAAKYDPLVLAEAFVDGIEVTASILGEQALPLVRIDAPAGNYDYHNKYFTDATKYYCPSGIGAEAESDIRRVALDAFRVLGCTGWGRADAILRADGTCSFLEMNTVPGLTGHSLVPMAAKQAGMTFADLALAILETAHVE
jgi:D-alanine-D-alanine ligase